MPFNTGSRLNHYEILEPVGRGGMGEVYRARDTTLGREVAIKVLPEAVAGDKERIDRFEREARLLAALNHRNIATLHGLERDGDLRFLVMELVEGEDLTARIARGPMPLDEAVRVFGQIASALEAAHEKGIVHRDLKPANVKLLPNGEVKVLDFGLAKAFAAELAGTSETNSPTLTRDGTKSGVLLGTAAYMSPEQARGEAVDRRADVWAFGCCLYEALTGKSAFGGRSVADTLAQILKHDPPLDGPATAPFKSLLSGCLRKDIDRRLGGMRDVSVALDNAHAGRSSARVRWAGAFAAAAVVLVVVILWIVERSLSPPPGPIELRLEGNATGAFDLSPNGATIVHPSDVSGERLLHLRQIVGSASEPISGTTRGYNPVFSPDGWSIAFKQGGVLKKVGLSGGPSIVVSDSVFVAARGADWGDDGTIVTAVGMGAISRVPSRGGELEPLTRLSPESDMAHFWPEILPGSEWVLFSALDAPGFDQRIMAQSLITDEVREVLRGGTAPQYASGFLVYAHTDALFAVRFDPETLEVSGEPVAVRKGVLTNPIDGGAFFRLAPNGTLAYRPADDLPGQTLVWRGLDGSRETLELPALQQRVGRDARLGTPRLSPAGDRLAIAVGGPSVGLGLWLYDLDHGTELALSDEEAAGVLEWSPSGQSIAYWVTGSGGSELVVRDVDRAGPARTLYRSPSIVWPVGWLPGDAGILVRQSNLGTGDTDISIVDNRQDATPEPLLNSSDNEGNAKLSRDGALLAYTTVRGSLIVCTYPDLGSRLRVVGEPVAEPLWSPDGSELYFRSSDGKRLMAVRVTREPELDVSESRVLFTGNFAGVPGQQTNYDITPDGQRFLMVEEEVLPETPPVITIVPNWLDEVKEKVAAANR